MNWRNLELPLSLEGVSVHEAIDVFLGALLVWANDKGFRGTPGGKANLVGAAVYLSKKVPYNASQVTILQSMRVEPPTFEAAGARFLLECSEALRLNSREQVVVCLEALMDAQALLFASELEEVLHEIRSEKGGRPV